jgi:FlaG/FlaF family flagellin (archaellin)
VVTVWHSVAKPAPTLPRSLAAKRKSSKLVVAVAVAVAVAVVIAAAVASTFTASVVVGGGAPSRLRARPDVATASQGQSKGGEVAA